MKTTIPQPALRTLFKSLLPLLCVILALLVQMREARAQTQNWWDNNGANPATSGTWDATTANWSASSSLTTPTVAFTNGNFAWFAAGTTPISALTITVNSPVTCAGLGAVTSGALVTNLTFSGSGSIGIASGMQGFVCGGPVGNLIINVPLTGPGGVEQEGNGYIALEGNNSYSGGTVLTGGQVIYFYNNNSFGTGPITNNGGTIYNSALVNNTLPAAALTITNNIVSGGVGYAMNLVGGVSVGGAPGTTWTGSITLAGPGNNSIYTGNNLAFVDEITGVIGDNGQGGNLIIADPGTMILAGPNTYTGTTTLGGLNTNNVVQVFVAENPGVSGPFGVPAIPEDSIIFNGGTLRYSTNNQYDYSSRFSSASANYTIDVYGQNITFASQISGGAALTNISSIAGGSLTLTGTNFYSGGTFLNSGTLIVNSMSDSGGSIGYGPVTLNGGALTYMGTGDTTVRNFTAASGSTTILDIPTSVTLELDGSMSGSAKWTINKIDSGTLILGGVDVNNAFCGVTINGGTVILNKTGTTGSALGSTTSVNSGGLLQLGGAGYGAEIYSGSTAPVYVNSGGVFDLDGQSNAVYELYLSGNGTGSGALINSAAGTVSVLTNANGSGIGIVLSNNVTIGGAGSITLLHPMSSYDDAPTSLTYAGTGVLTLAGTNANTYLGGTFVSSGTLDAATAGSLPGNVTLNGGVLEMDIPGAMSPAATLNLPASPTAGMLNLTYSGPQYILALTVGGVPVPAGTYSSASTLGGVSGVITGPGSLVISGGPLYWDPNRTGGTSLGGSGTWDTSTTTAWWNESSDSTWAANSVANFGGTSGTVTVANGGATTFGINFTTAGYTINNTDGTSSLALGGAAPAIAVPAGNSTISCNLTGGGTNTGLTVTGPGTLTLTGTNTFSNGVTVNGATLSVNSIADSGTSALGIGGTNNNVTLLGGGTLSYTGAGSNSTSCNITNDGITTAYINVPNGTLNLAGAVRIGSDLASPALTKTGNGTLYLGGNSNDNAGLTMAIDAGTVIISKTNYSGAHGLGGGTSSVASGAELQLAGPGGSCLYSGCILSIVSGGLLDVNGQNDSFSTLTLAGVGTGSGTSAGALINSAATTSAITNGGSGVVLSAPATIGGVGNINLHSAVSGAGPLTYTGSGTLTLFNAGSYSGGTFINAGSTMQLNNQSAAGTGTITLNGGNSTTSTLGVAIGSGTLTNPVVGGSAAVINIIETAAQNLSMSGNLSSYTGTINAPTTPGTTAKFQLETSTLNSAATINVAAGGTLYIPTQTNAATVYLNGLGNTEVYGALRIDAGMQIGPVILNNNSSIGNGNGGNSTISGVISDGGHGYGLAKGNTANPMTLTAVNTFSGGLTISNGMLIIGGAGQLNSGNYAAKITNVVAGSIFNYSSTANQTLSGVISGSGVVVVNKGTLSLTGANTYTGGTTISNGTLIVSAIADTGTSSIGPSGTLGLGNGTLSYTNTTIANTARAVTCVVKNSTSTINLPNGNLTLSGAITANPGAAFTINKAGAGTLTISGTGNNTFDGINIQGGLVILNKSGTANAVGGPVTVNSGTELQFGNTGGGTQQFYTGATTPLKIAGGGIFDVNGQSMTIYSISVAGAGNGSGAISNSAASVCTLTSPITMTNNTSIGCAAGGGITLPNAIGGAYGLTDLGPGNLTLGASNTYTGTTMVSAGILDINASGSVQGNVTVSTAATLEMDNTTAMASGATLTVASGATVNLTYSGTDTINALFVAGVAQPPGVYGASASNPGGVFTGAGTVTVAPSTQPPVKILTATINGSNQFVVSWSSVPGVNYNVCTSTNLTLPLNQWTVINSSPITATGTNTSYTLPGSVLAQSRLFVAIQQ